MKQNLRFIFMTLLCAVFSTAWGETATLTNANIVAAGEAAGGYTGFSIKDDNGKTWNAYAIKNKHSNATSDYHYLQIKKNDNNGPYYIQVPEFGSRITSIKMTVSSTSKPMTDGGNSATLYFSNSNSTSAEGEGVASGTGASSVTIDCSSLNLNTGYITASGAVRIWDVEVTYTGTTPTVAAPTFTPASGVVDLGTEVTISAAEGLSLYYTTDGTDPTASNTVIDAEGNTATVTINSTTTIKAVAMDGDANFSNVVSAEYKIVVAAPTFNPEGGAYTETQNVTISAAEGCTISYTTDGSDPIESNTAVTSDGNTATVEVSRSMTIKAVAMDSQANFSEVATANYSFVSAIATLPFKFDGNSNEVSSISGLTAEGLGNYNSSPKLQFNSSGDYLILHFDERPGDLSFNIKGNSFSGGTFKVQTSEDGETFTDLDTYIDLESSATPVLLDNLGESVRYIKWIYTEKVSGNVALGNIELKQYVPKYTLTITPNDNAEIFTFYNNEDYTEIQNGGKVPANTEVLVSVSVNEDYQVEGITVIDGNNQNVTVAAEQDGISWTFIMPESDVTVSVTVSQIPPSDKLYSKVTSTADLKNGEYLIVCADQLVVFNGSLSSLDNSYNMVSLNGIDSDGHISGTTALDAATFTIDVENGTIKSASGFYIGRTSSSAGLNSSQTEGYTNTISFDGNGNAIIKGTGADNMTLQYNDGGNRFRYYTSTQKPIQLYKLVTYDVTINPLATDGTDCYATVSNLGEGNWTVPAGVTASTVVVGNNGQLTYPFEAAAGEKIPGNGAYLLKGNAGAHSFVYSTSEETVDIGNNMLYSTGEGNFLTVGPDNGSYFFYKLARNKAGDDNSVGFYWHNSDGSAFTYPTGHQAYLAVPQNLVSQTSSFSFDGTNGIRDINADSDSSREIYSITGVRVNNSQLTKGIYIINGKKTIIK